MASSSALECLGFNYSQQVLKTNPEICSLYLRNIYSKWTDTRPSCIYTYRAPPISPDFILVQLASSQKSINQGSGGWLLIYQPLKVTVSTMHSSSQPLLMQQSAWIIHQKAVKQYSYVDEFILVGEPRSTQCASSMDSALKAFHKLGIPIEPELRPSDHSHSAWYWSRHSRNATASPSWGALPNVRINCMLPGSGHKCCTKLELPSPIGLLQHAATVTRPEQSFVTRMINLSLSRKHMEARIHLDREFRSDLEWWFHGVGSSCSMKWYIYSCPLESIQFLRMVSCTCSRTAPWSQFKGGHPYCNWSHACCGVREQ